MPLLQLLLFLLLLLPLLLLLLPFFVVVVATVVIAVAVVVVVAVAAAFNFAESSDLNLLCSGKKERSCFIFHWSLFVSNLISGASNFVQKTKL